MSEKTWWISFFFRDKRKLYATHFQKQNATREKKNMKSKKLGGLENWKQNVPQTTQLL